LLLRDLFADAEQSLQERCFDTLESSAFHDPERVALDWNLCRQFAVMHSPQETAEYAGQMPAMQIETAERAAGRGEASAWQLRKVVVSDSDLHVSDRALIILPVHPILTIEQLNMRGIADGVDHG